MRSRGIGTAAVLLCLAAPSAAVAADWAAAPAGGPCDATNRTCATIQAAVTAAATGDTVKIQPKTNGWAENVTISDESLTLRGDGGGEVQVKGTVSFTGSGTTLTVQRLTLLAQTGPAVNVTLSDVEPTKTITLQSSILSGAGAAAVKATTNVASVNAIAIEGRHVTIADASGGAAFDQVERPGLDSISAAFRDSIVQGDIDGATQTNPQPDATNNASLFTSHASEVFHLPLGSAAIDQGGPGAGEFATDVDGETRAGTWDRGADEFVNYAPTKPALGQPAASVQPGELVGFFASASDPNQALGDAVVKYRWTFGDGTGQETDQGSVTHGYAAPGTYLVQVRAVDRLGAEGPVSDAVAVSVSNPPPATPAGGLTSITQLPGFGAPVNRGPDGAPPAVSITSPRPNQRVKVRRIVPLLRGRATDQSGVRRVELALMRREGTRCRWYDGRGAFRLGRCNVPSWFRAVVDDAAWRYAFPRRVRPRPGAYFAFARGTDYAGNRTSAFTRANAIAFRYTR